MSTSLPDSQSREHQPALPADLRESVRTALALAARYREALDQLIAEVTPFFGTERVCRICDAQLVQVATDGEPHAAWCSVPAAQAALAGFPDSPESRAGSQAAPDAVLTPSEQALVNDWATLKTTTAQGRDAQKLAHIIQRLTAAPAAEVRGG